MEILSYLHDYRIMEILERYFLCDTNINLRDAKQDLLDARYHIPKIDHNIPCGLYCSLMNRHPFSQNLERR